jgi:3-hydroxyisobutyrate dehydrogenase
VSNIAWIGLGNMGLPMATRLAAAGHTVRGFDVSAAAAEAARRAGIDVDATVAEVVRHADAVFTMLPSDRVAQNVLAGPGGVLASVVPGTLVVDGSTIGVATCRRLSKAAAAVGVEYLDAPVSGGATAAQAGTLTIMVGADEALFERARPLLGVVGRDIVRMGETGAGVAAKIVNNMIMGINLAAVCEAVALGERLGLDMAALYEVVSNSSADSWALRSWYPADGVLDSAPACHGYVPGFRTSTLAKDLGLALDAGTFSGAPLDAAAAAHRLFSDHAAAGFADLDCSSLYLSLASAAGASRAA